MLGLKEGRIFRRRPKHFRFFVPHTQSMQDDVAAVANLLGEPARAAMLLSLMNGHMLPAGELAMKANVSPQTASGHLGRLVEGGLLAVETQGRHRYYRIAGTSVADAVEALMALTSSTREKERKNAERPSEGTFGYARTCYAHLAGWLGVSITEALEQRGLLLPAQGKAFAVSDAGRAWFREVGIPVPAARKGAEQSLARRCLDWTERRPHLSGALGVALARRLLELGWIAPVRDSRALRVTVEGRQQLWRLLRLPLGR
jgi:DNA-binding transcriptional ArsR family regulator